MNDSSSRNQKALTVFIILFAGLHLRSLGQEINVRIGMTYYTRAFVTLNGSTPGAVFFWNNSHDQHMEAEYCGRKNNTFTIDYCRQKETYSFSSTDPVSPNGVIPLVFKKVYSSDNFGMSAGHKWRMQKLPIDLIIKGGISIGVVQVDPVNIDERFDGWITQVDQTGNHPDSVHVFNRCSDASLDKIHFSTFASAGVEYHLRSFLLGIYLNGTRWLGSFEELNYYREYSDSYSQESAFHDGRFSINAGYAGITFSLGWRFSGIKYD